MHAVFSIAFDNKVGQLPAMPWASAVVSAGIRHKSVLVPAQIDVRGNQPLNTAIRHARIVSGECRYGNNCILRSTDAALWLKEDAVILIPAPHNF